MRVVFEHGVMPPREIAFIINELIQGNNNASNQIQVGDGVATTTVFQSDSIGTRINEKSVITFMPLTASAAAELYSGNMYCLAADIINGQFTVTHSTGANALDFRILVMGGDGL